MEHSTTLPLISGGYGEPPVGLLSQLETAILGRQGRPEGRETRFLCPAHDDHHPSARWNPEKKTWVCDACGAGGGWSDLSKRLGLELSRPISDRIVSRYPYHDEQGRLLFEVVRFDPKEFRQRRPDGAGGWAYSLNGTRRVLYNLPRVLAAVAAGETIWLVEGEKDGDNLIERGLVATTNPGGAGKWRDEYSETLRGARVVILPDNDDPGRQHAQKVAQHLQGVAAEVRVLELRGLPEKGDVSDWIREREEEDGKDHESTRATLKYLASTAPVVSARDSAPLIGTGGRAETEAFEISARDSAREGQPPVGGLGDGRKSTLFVTARETCSEAAEEVDWIVKPFLASGCLTDLAGPAKAAGKTTLTLAMIREVVDGGEFLGRRTAQSRGLPDRAEPRHLSRSVEPRPSDRARRPLHPLRSQGGDTIVAADRRGGGRRVPSNRCTALGRRHSTRTVPTAGRFGEFGRGSSARTGPAPTSRGRTWACSSLHPSRAQGRRPRRRSCTWLKRLRWGC